MLPCNIIIHWLSACPKWSLLNTLRQRQNGLHFTDDTYRCIFLNENVCISIEISLQFEPKGPINNMLALVQIMAWHRPGDKPLSEPMMVSLLTHICVTRTQWVKSGFYVFPSLCVSGHHHWAVLWLLRANGEGGRRHPCVHPSQTGKAHTYITGFPFTNMV